MSFIEDLNEQVHVTPGTYRPKWFERLPDSVREDVLYVKNNWETLYPNSSGSRVARALLALLKQRGIAAPAEDSITRWLRKKTS